MRPILILCAFVLATLSAIPSAEARRGSCANGQCSVRTADATPKDFVPAPKAVDAAPVGDSGEGRQPVRRVGKAVGRKLLAPVRLLRGCRGGRCGN